MRDFVTRPFVEQAQTRNEPGEAGETTADDLDLGLHLEEVMEQLKELFPENCRFGNHRLDVKAVTSETGFVFVAPVPVCIVQQNWKQF